MWKVPPTMIFKTDVASDSPLSRNIEDDHSIWSTISRVVMGEAGLYKKQMVESLKQHKQL